MLYKLIALAFLFGSRPPELRFEKTMLDPGAAESAAFADVNGDKRLDIVSGEFWYEAPAWTPHRFREIAFLNNYVDDFADLVADYDGDGAPDVVSVGWFGKIVSFWKNPGKVGGAREAVTYREVVDDRRHDRGGPDGSGRGPAIWGRNRRRCASIARGDLPRSSVFRAHRRQPARAAGRAGRVGLRRLHPLPRQFDPGAPDDQQR